MPKNAIKRKRRRVTVRRGNRVIIYIRVSDTTGREDTLISDEVQLAQCLGLIKRENLVAVGEPIIELDKSGRESDKRAIARIIDQIEDGEADGVVVWKISRWGRNTMDSMLNIGELQDAGGFILSATENLDDIDTPAGKFSLTVLLAIAQMYSDEIGKTWANIHDYRRAKGLTANGTPRLGYVRDKSTDTYTPDPQTAEWVRQAFEWYVAGESLKSIVRRLDEAGVSSTRGNRLTTSSLRTSMDGGFAAGLVVDRRGDEEAFVKGTHPALISDDLWQHYLRRRKQKVAPRIKSAPYRVAGLMKCAGCGGGMGVSWRGGKDGARTKFFRCNKTDAAYNTTTCAAPATVSEYIVERALLDWLREHHTGQQALDASMERARRVTRATVDVKKIEKDIERAVKRLSILTDKNLDGEISKEAYQIKEAEISADIDRLRASRESATVDIEVNSMPAMDVFGAVLTGWELLDPAVFNEGLRRVIRSIRVTKAPGRGKNAGLRIVGAWEPELQVVRAG